MTYSEDWPDPPRCSKNRANWTDLGGGVSHISYHSLFLPSVPFLYSMFCTSLQSYTVCRFICHSLGISTFFGPSGILTRIWSSMFVIYRCSQIWCFTWGMLTYTEVCWRMLTYADSGSSILRVVCCVHHVYLDSRLLFWVCVMWTIGTGSNRWSIIIQVSPLCSERTYITTYWRLNLQFSGIPGECLFILESNQRWFY